MLWSGQFFGAAKALELSYVLEVVPQDSLKDEVRTFAQKLAAGPPIAMQLTKRLVFLHRSRRPWMLPKQP